MKHLLKILTIFTLSLIILSCNNDDDKPVTMNTNVTFKATLSGANESTPNSSTATGTGSLVFNTSTKIFTLTVNHTLASVTSGHIHKGAVGTSGPVVFPLGNLVTPIVYTSVALDAMQEADLNAGLYYINLHSAAFPAGEIRGQLIK